MDLVDFPPFYTIQNVLASREKQLDLWRQLIIKQCEKEQTMVIDLATFPAFSNSKINRSMDTEGRRTVAEALVSSGYGEWEDPATKTRVRVYSRTPEAWAAVVYEWAKDTARVGEGISTFYEIHSGDDVQGTEIANIHSDVLFKALKALEKQGKAQLYPGATLDETGVKFL